MAGKWAAVLGTEFLIICDNKMVDLVCHLLIKTEFLQLHLKHIKALWEDTSVKTREKQGNRVTLEHSVVR